MKKFGINDTAVIPNIASINILCLLKKVVAVKLENFSDHISCSYELMAHIHVPKKLQTVTLMMSEI